MESNNTPFVADKNTISTLMLAIKYANDFTIQHSGITRDGYLVTTKQCVDYRIKKNDLLLSFDGNWEIIKSDGSMGWEQRREMRIRYYKEMNEETLFKYLQSIDDIDFSFAHSRATIIEGVVRYNLANDTNFDAEDVWEKYINR